MASVGSTDGPMPALTTEEAADLERRSDLIKQLLGVASSAIKCAIDAVSEHLSSLEWHASHGPQDILHEDTAAHDAALELNWLRGLCDDDLFDNVRRLVLSDLASCVDKAEDDEERQRWQVRVNETEAAKTPEEFLALWESTY